MIPGTHEPQLVNILGHSAGAVIFGIFLFLLLRDRAGARLRGSWLSVAAAGLAFLWNCGSLAGLLAGGENHAAARLLAAFSFSMLTLLPAVMLHLSVDNRFGVLVAGGYSLSAVAALMHAAEVLEPARDYHEMALILITVGFGLLTGAAALAIALQGDHERRAKASRILGAMCASLFAMSFPHFGSAHPPHAWSSELALHHAGIPLALFVLLQDYRFVLLDAFVRFLANAMLAGLFTFALVRAALPLIEDPRRIPQNPIYGAFLLIGLSLTLIVFALLRTHLQRWLTHVVFRRKDLDKAIIRLQSGPAVFPEERDYLRSARAEIAAFMETSRVEECSEEDLRPALRGVELVAPAPAEDLPGMRTAPEFDWVEAVAPVRMDAGDVRFFLLGRRRGGRRYLSEDLTALSRLVAAVLEQVARFRKTEMERLVSQAELKALQSQINPHFLFNALNTLYGIIPREAAGARRTVLNLSDIFRYFLQSEKAFITLAEELQIVRAYLEIERLRLGSRLETEIVVDESAEHVQIPILSIQPLVENAVKHGVSARAEPGRLRLEIRAHSGKVTIKVEDSGPGMQGGKRPGAMQGTGVGLANVTRRLQLCYGPQANLRIESGPLGTTVEFSVPDHRMAVAR